MPPTPAAVLSEAEIDAALDLADGGDAPGVYAETIRKLIYAYEATKPYREMRRILREQSDAAKRGNGLLATIRACARQGMCEDIVRLIDEFMRPGGFVRESAEYADVQVPRGGSACVCAMNAEPHYHLPPLSDEEIERVRDGLRRIGFSTHLVIDRGCND